MSLLQSHHLISYVSLYLLGILATLFWCQCYPMPLPAAGGSVIVDREEGGHHAVRRASQCHSPRRPEELPQGRDGHPRESLAHTNWKYPIEQMVCLIST